LATLKLVVNVVGELETEKNSCGIARFPCDSTAFLLFLGPTRTKPIGARKLKKEGSAVGIYSVAVNVLRKETAFPL